MVSAWYMKTNVCNKKLENCTEPIKPITLDVLEEKTGVVYYKLDPKNYAESLNKIKHDRGYSYTDIIEVSPKKLANYDQKLNMFFEEHLHTDEEIRYILDGSGYFDVRDNEDNWVRILVQSGDLIVLPAGIYHRFTLDIKDYIKAMRLFVGEPVWTPHNRPADDMDARKNYIQWQNNKLIS